MKQLLLLTITLFTFSNITAQHNLPPNPKAGECYMRCTSENKTTEWIKLNCKLVKELNEKHLKNGVKAFKYKLINLGYKLELNEYLDEKTIDAFKDFKKTERKRNRKNKKRKRSKD